MSNSEIAALGAVLVLGLAGFFYAWISLGRAMRHPTSKEPRAGGTSAQMTLSDEMMASTQAAATRPLIGSGR